uniref:Uncharacterized protein n=1 Tax=Manihot esculenta TaxID=3983 RepID=A0A2C9UUM5_MANES
MLSSILEANNIGFGDAMIFNTAFLISGEVILELKVPSLMSLHISRHISSNAAKACTML